MLAIFKKEVAIYFQTPFGYVFSGLFLLLSGIIFSFYNLYGSRADIFGMLGALNIASIVIFPVLTMKLLSEERKMSTEQLLFTAPVKITSIIIGKYLAALFVFLVTLTATGIFSVFIAIFGKASIGSILGAYFGFAMLGAAYIAICLFASCLTENQVTSAITGFGFLFGFMIIGFLSNSMPTLFLKKVVNSLAILSKYDEFSNGILKAGPLVYYMSFAIVFLFLTVMAVEHRLSEKEENKKLFTRLNSVILIPILIAILVTANLIAEKLPWKFDMTADKVFTLSEQTRKVIDDLDRNINITAFFREGEEDPTVRALLEEYVKAGAGKIKTEYTDAERNPIAAKRLDANNEGIFNDSIVFESDGRIKKVNKFDIFNLNSAYGKSFSGEQQFTGALLYITSPKLAKVYFLEGHQETELNSELFKLKSKIENEASTAESLNLIKVGGVPEDADVVVVASPKRDLSAAEKTMLQQYLSQGGRMILLFDVPGAQIQLDNFGELLNFYGIGINNNFVVEENQNYYYTNNNMYLVPDYADQSIVKNMKAENLAIIFPYSMNLEILQTDDKNLITEPVLRTSDRSWSRYNIMDATPTMTDDDVAGPANVAVAVERDNSDDRQKNTKIFVAGNAKFIDNNMLEVQGNVDLFMNAVNWVRDKKEAISIRSKVLNSNQMMVKGPTFTALLIVSIVIIPMLAFGAGFLMWLRRRHA